MSCYPNAGLPNAFGGYDDTPEQMAEILEVFTGYFSLQFSVISSYIVTTIIAVLYPELE